MLAQATQVQAEGTLSIPLIQDGTPAPLRSVPSTTDRSAAEVGKAAAPVSI